MKRNSHSLKNLYQRELHLLREILRVLLLVGGLLKELDLLLKWGSDSEDLDYEPNYSSSLSEYEGSEEGCRVTAVERFVLENVESPHSLEDDYMTDKLDSGDDDSKNDVGPKPKYHKFRERDICREFKFKIGMEFASL